MTSSEFNSLYPVGSEFMWRPFQFLQGNGIRVVTTGEAISDGKDIIVPIYNDDFPRHANLDELTPVQK
ncbi:MULTISPECIES: hypothetical protein [Vibrio harveyi group]|uniref:Uncharacterized protein n=1 Tax=Vibrio owensii CAIM 1854 = LMG 25443 TaxID=1229493 RepID=A0A0C1ZJI2_9VIBR|nr:hypothetical protein [Vibrio owensii]KIF53331.1 hypothetical protein H735_10430 [Vibrio owensii CAIM 1854 = LMG 25443]